MNGKEERKGQSDGAVVNGEEKTASLVEKNKGSRNEKRQGLNNNTRKGKTGNKEE